MSLKNLDTNQLITHSFRNSSGSEFNLMIFLKNQKSFYKLLTPGDLVPGFPLLMDSIIYTLDVTNSYVM